MNDCTHFYYYENDISSFGFTDLLCDPFHEFETIIRQQGIKSLLLVWAELEHLQSELWL